ncbi:MAG: hypothetical protein IB616_01625 [Methanosarcinales archaeon]|nr:MAG: hypothetical protein IB616_01625 [Methanosarcinales archaeon]
MKATDKPSFCTEANCECIWHTLFEPDDWKDGYSFECIGRMKEPVEFKYKKAVHVNTHYHCIWTPLKGWVKFDVTIEDIWYSARVITNFLKSEDPKECAKCGIHTRMIRFTRCPHCSKLACEICAPSVSIRIKDQTCIYCGKSLVIDTRKKA